MKALFDTNIIIDYLVGERQAKEEIELYDNRAISIITYIELIVGLSNEKDIRQIKQFLQDFSIIDVDISLVEHTAFMRKKYKLKLPDAIILATAYHYQYLFVTRDRKDFHVTLPIVRIPYSL